MLRDLIFGILTIKFFGEKLTIKNEGQSILDERDAMERIQNENNANE